LIGSLSPGQYLLIQEAQGTGGTTPLPTPDVTDSSPIAMSSAGGKVALVNTSTPLGCNGDPNPCSPEALSQLVDLVGWGAANFYEGSGPAPATSNTTAIFRSNGGCTDSDNNNADFDPATAPSPRNTASPTHSCEGPSNPSGVGLATPDILFAGDSTLLTVAVTPGANPTSTGLAVTCDLSAIGGPANQAFYDDGTHGDDTAADHTFSYSTTIAPETSDGPQSLACTITDAELRTGNATINLTVTVILPIGTVQGVVGDSDDGATFPSPYAGQTVTIQGVIYENLLSQTSSGSSSHNLFVQNTAATADGEPDSSDGIYVYIGYYSTLRIKGGGYYTPLVGDEVILQGPISEYYNMTEIGNPYVLSVVRHGVVLDDEVPAFDVNPPDDLADANRYWERHEGMRGQIPEGSIVLGGRNVFSPSDAEIWVARPDSTIGLRTELYTNRAFRDADPLDDNYDATSWDGNGYRILMGSYGVKADLNDPTALIAPARTFDTLAYPATGGLYFDYGKYSIEPDQQVIFDEGVDPALNHPPTEFDRNLGYSIADYNLENLYDYRDNPFSGCDFAGDSGCSNAGTPFLGSVNSPYDYVPASEAAYQARLNDIALQIINDLHSPDILMVQEVENQDICQVSDGAMVCSLTDNSDADGQPDVLQDLALKIAANGGPEYAAAFDPDSSDLRGILPAFLYRSDRVELESPVGDPVLGENPVIGSYTPVAYDSQVSNPKTLNALYTGSGACETSWVFPRAPSVGLFRIYNTTAGVGSYRDVYLINNHFKSGPDGCVAHRTEQAKFNAALVAYLEAANPYARIVVGGDLNVYPRPDDPFAPIGQDGSSDQLGALYDPSLGLTNLWQVLLDQAPEAAYSYVYLGMAQTLDQMFVNQRVLADLDQFRIAHINSDFPADYPDDVARGTSDHDPNVATFGIYIKTFLPLISDLSTVH
jgi:predicted extracellular nuclease